MGINIAEIDLGQSQDLRIAAGGAAMKYAADNDRLYNAGRDFAKSASVDMAQAVTNMAIPATFAGPAGPVAAIGVGIAAGALKSIFGRHSAPVYRRPAGFDPYLPTPRDWVVVVEALRYVVANPSAMKSVEKEIIPITVSASEFPVAWNTPTAEKARRIEAYIKTQVNALLTLLTMKGKKLLTAGQGAKILDKTVIGSKYAGPDISIAGWKMPANDPKASAVHWFNMSNYTPRARWLAGDAYHNSAIVHAALIQLANALPAHVWTEEVHLPAPEPRIAMTKDLPKKDTKEVTGLMPPDWSGNLRFVLSWVEHRQVIIKGEKPVSYSLTSKAKIEAAIALFGGSTVACISGGMFYRLRPILVYRAGGENPDKSGGRTVFLEQFGIAQVPGGHAALKTSAEKLVQSVADTKVKALKDIAAKNEPPKKVKQDVPEPKPEKPTTAIVELPSGGLKTVTIAPSVAEKDAEKKASMTPWLIGGAAVLGLGAIVLLSRK